LGDLRKIFKIRDLYRSGCVLSPQNLETKEFAGKLLERKDLVGILHFRHFSAGGAKY
jgi:hypothetical protein